MATLVAHTGNDIVEQDILVGHDQFQVSAEVVTRDEKTLLAVRHYKTDVLHRNAKNYAGAHGTRLNLQAIWLMSTHGPNMNSTYTTHLICAPQLEGRATIGALLAAPGSRVEVDAPLLQLQTEKQVLEVCAPETGIVGDYTVTLNENVESGDLLLTMEIEEKPFGFFPILEEEPAFAPACLQAQPKPVPSRSIPLQIAPEAASLAARLGVDLAVVKPGPDDIIDEEAVCAHVRDVMVRWKKLLRLTSA